MRVDWVSNDLEKYFHLLEEVGQGAYGVVRKCKRKSDGKILAIKFVKQFDGKRTKKKGLRIDVYREIQILNCLYDEDNGSLNHDFRNDRVVMLKQLLIGDMCDGKYNLGLVFRYYPLSLSQIIGYHKGMAIENEDRYFDEQWRAKALYQILEGVDALHTHWILHRDLKPSNILIDVHRGGIIKLCDFGLSKLFQKYQTKVNIEQKDGEIVTLFYRSPELFLTQKNENIYHESPSIDMWSVGCIFAELITLKTLFRVHGIGNFKNAQERNKQVLKSICLIMSFPVPNLKLNKNEEHGDIDIDNDNDLRRNCLWRDCESLFYYPWIEKWKTKFQPIGLFRSNKCLTNLSSNEKALLKGMLMMDPNNRMTAKQALNHKYFKKIRHSLKYNGQKEILLYPNGKTPLFNK